MYTYVIIDDEPLIRRGTKKKLEPLSHLLTCCGEASDGREGLEPGPTVKTRHRNPGYADAGYGRYGTTSRSF